MTFSGKCMGFVCEFNKKKKKNCRRSYACELASNGQLENSEIKMEFEMNCTWRQNFGNNF